MDIKSKELDRLIRWMWDEGLITIDEKYHGRCSVLIDDWGIRDEED